MGPMAYLATGHPFHPHHARDDQAVPRVAGDTGPRNGVPRTVTTERLARPREPGSASPASTGVDGTAVRA